MSPKNYSSVTHKDNSIVQKNAEYCMYSVEHVTIEELEN